jgi:hypothetical protein
MPLKAVTVMKLLQKILWQHRLKALYGLELGHLYWQDVLNRKSRLDISRFQDKLPCLVTSAKPFQYRREHPRCCLDVSTVVLAMMLDPVSERNRSESLLGLLHEKG